MGRQVRHRERAGLLFATLCALNGAFVPGFAKLTTSLATPLFVATTTAVIAGLCAAVVLCVRGELRALIAPRARLRLAAIGMLGTAVAFLLMFAGTQRSSAIEAALCLQVEPAYSLLATWLVLGHRPTPARVQQDRYGAGGLVCHGEVERPIAVEVANRQ